ncbi:MAG: UvrD-helicase domain-containing protein [Anaerolineae bacterium]|nr:UvrD-helicase domain-containing protein [Anaerolineae bacterium]
MVSNTHPLLRSLNAQQCEAVTVSDGPVLVLAGPGSGKTRVLTHRIAWMLTEQQVPPWRVLAVTFTNKAAREMRERIDGMLDSAGGRDILIGTFHAMCARILRREADWIGLPKDYLIFDTDDQLAVMKMVVKELGLDDKRYRPRGLLNAISAAKNELILPPDYPVRTYHDEVVARAYARYQATLRNNNALDFDDLLVEPVRLFRSQPEVLAKYRDRFRYLLVDEFQDTNIAQYVLLRLLSQDHRSLFVVADEDQSIYSWRGADYRNIQRLHTDYPELVEILLVENYRSTQVILDAARALISHNVDRTPKDLFTRKQGGAPPTVREAYDEEEEGSLIAREVQSLRGTRYGYGDIAVMYRTNAQSRALEEAFIRQGIPYRLIGATRFYSRKEIKDVLAFLRLVQNPEDSVSFQRVVNVPARGIGARTLAKIAAQAERDGKGHYQACLVLLAQGGLGSRTSNAVQGFVDLVQMWRPYQSEATVMQLLDRILSDTDYESYVKDGTPEGDSRWENVMALRAVVEEAPLLSLADFLTEVALVADIDEIEDQVEAVTLLTLHSAKGLEYPVVFIAGLEEGMLPHSRAIEESPQAVAEERRLLYVGMTRAMERLYLSYAFRRNWYGNNEPATHSRFLDDLPDDVVGGRRSRRQVQTTHQNWGVPAWPTGQSVGGRPERQQIQRKFQRGQRVRHRRFGEGAVQDSQIEGNDEIVTVLFFDNRVGVKHFLAGAAPLESVSEH